MLAVGLLGGTGQALPTEFVKQNVEKILGQAGKLDFNDDGEKPAMNGRVLIDAYIENGLKLLTLDNLFKVIQKYSELKMVKFT